jgi:hypothetical protein
LTDREAERAVRLAERLGASTPPQRSLASLDRRCARFSPATVLACRVGTPKAVRQRAIAAVRQRTSQPANPTLDPVFMALNPGAPYRPGSGQLSSCMRGSAARSSTPSWARMWWSSWTARAALAGPPPGSGRSSAGPTAATVVTSTANSVATAATLPAPPGGPHQPTRPSPGAGMVADAQPPWRHGAWPRSRVAEGPILRIKACLGGSSEKERRRHP